jgi:MFS family permease
MVLLDGTIVLVALPSIEADLGFSGQGLQWVLSAYALTFGGLLWLSYIGDIFFGLLGCGLGIGLAFVTATVAALPGVAEHESGLASGLSNTALQVGGALGVAIVTTVAVSRSEDYVAANDGTNPLVVLNEGFQSAFLACGVLAGTGLTLALVLLGRPRKAPRQRLEPVPAIAGDR